jgi:hypothetical protein
MCWKKWTNNLASRQSKFQNIWSFNVVICEKYSLPQEHSWSENSQGNRRCCGEVTLGVLRYTWTVNSSAFVKLCTNFMNLQRSPSWFFHRIGELWTMAPFDSGFWSFVQRERDRKITQVLLRPSCVKNRKWKHRCCAKHRCNDEDWCKTITWFVKYYSRSHKALGMKVEVKPRHSISRHNRPIGGWTGTRVCLDVWWRGKSQPTPRTELRMPDT